MSPQKIVRTSAALSPQQEISELAEARQVKNAFAWFSRHEKKLSHWQMELAGIPAPPFGEARRAAWLRQKFSSLGLQRAQLDEAGNVVGFRKGWEKDGPVVAVIAHIDTVFAEGTPIQIRHEGGKLFGPGISDNASGVTALLALAAALEATDISHASTLALIGTVGEEGEGDLRGIRHIFSHAPFRSSIAHALVVDGAGTETIVNHGLGSRRFEITARGKGGHSWSDFGTPNPIALLARAVTEFCGTEVSRAAKKRSAYNVGTFQGGTSVNSIPESASMRVDLRSESQDEIRRLETALRAAVAKAQSLDTSAAADRLRCDIKTIGERPAAELSPSARILQLVRAVDEQLDIDSRPHCSSTDANIPLALGWEAISIGAGGSGGGAHTLSEWFDPAGRDLGLKRILLTVLALARAEAG